MKPGKTADTINDSSSPSFLGRQVFLSFLPAALFSSTDRHRLAQLKTLAIIGEFHIVGQVLHTPDQALGRLQGVLVLARNAELITLDLRVHLDSGSLNLPHERFGLFRGYSLAQG